MFVLSVRATMNLPTRPDFISFEAAVLVLDLQLCLFTWVFLCSLVGTSFGFRQHKKWPCGDNILSLGKEFDACPRCNLHDKQDRSMDFSINAGQRNYLFGKLCKQRCVWFQLCEYKTSQVGFHKIVLNWRKIFFCPQFLRYDFKVNIFQSITYFLQ